MKTLRNLHESLLSLHSRTAVRAHGRSPHARAEAFARRMRAWEFSCRIRHHGPASQLGVVLARHDETAGMLPAGTY